MSDPDKIPKKTWARLLDDMVDFVTDEQEIVRIEAVAGLAAFLQCFPNSRGEIIA